MFNRILVSALCLSAAALAQNDNGNGNGNGPGNNGKVIHETKDTNASTKAGTSSSIVYHGGAVMATPNVYYIWYGGWSTNDPAISILTNLAQHIGGSPYFNINKTYYSSINGVTTPVTGGVSFINSTTDSYSHGTTLTDAAVQAVVSAAISSGRLPKDTNGIYFVLTSSDVKESSGFCTQYCGWHTHGTISGSDIKYAFIGNPATQCPSACEELTTSSPNGNLGADAMASIIAHELEEATTDPDLNAWYDRRGAENADKCAWTFGTTYTSTNGSPANMNINGKDYLIQQNWVNSGSGYCALK